MRSSPYKNWVNIKDPGAFAFVTTTCLDFVHLFAKPKFADLMTGSLLNDLRYYKAHLWAYCVMPHHAHMLVKAPMDKTISWLMSNVKSNSARRLLSEMSSRDREAFAQQFGLNQRSIWKRSFRGAEVRTEKVRVQKMNYIHMNPVRAGLVDLPEHYRWSSARIWIDGKGTDDGIEITNDLIEQFASFEQLNRLWQPKRNLDERDP